jgi:AcrR family transcriptional regulator
VTSRTEHRPRRRLSAADRREAILAAALEVFSERGFHEASLEDVAARDGVSKALIYEHFASKHELQRALMETYVRELLGRVIAAIESAEPGEERLRVGVDAFLGFVEERRGAWRMLVRNVTDPEMAAALARFQEEVGAAIAVLMAADVRHTRLADPHLDQAVDMLARQLVGAVQALANWWNDNPEVPRERVLALAMDFAWLGLGRLGDGERWTGG